MLKSTFKVIKIAVAADGSHIEETTTRRRAPSSSRKPTLKERNAPLWAWYARNISRCFVDATTTTPFVSQALYSACRVLHMEGNFNEATRLSVSCDFDDLRNLMKSFGYR